MEWSYNGWSHTCNDSRQDDVILTCKHDLQETLLLLLHFFFPFSRRNHIVLSLYTPHTHTLHTLHTLHTYHTHTPHAHMYITLHTHTTHTVPEEEVSNLLGLESLA